MCLKETTSTEYNSLPPEPCLRLRAEVFFPSCWDGVNLDSSDHKSHVRTLHATCAPTLLPQGISSLFFYGMILTNN